jgi:hypothetical protein
VNTFASWTIDASHPEIVPVSFAQASDGVVWLGGGLGMLGTVSQGQQPVWTQQVAGTIPKEMQFDGAGRLWMTDMTDYQWVEQGVVHSFVLSSLGSEDQIADIRPWLALLDPALQNELSVAVDSRPDVPAVNVLTPLADGRMSVNNGFYVAQFPVQLGNMEIVDPVASSSLALAVAPNGDVWSRRVKDSVLVRVWATSTQTYADTASTPHDAIRQPRLFASDNTSVYTIDYTPTSTVLWHTLGSDWIANIVSASGTLPNDAVNTIRVDGAGNVWAALKQGGLLKISRPKH